MEVWDLFDENRRPLGKQAGRREPIVKGEFHIVVVVCVINEQNEILLTLRSPDKRNIREPGRTQEELWKPGRKAVLLIGGNGSCHLL